MNRERRRLMHRHMVQNKVPRLFALVAASLLISAAVHAEPKHYDVVIYGGTAGGVVSAVSIAREGGVSVIVLEPTEHVGGMVSGGLGWTDFGTWQSIGGMAAEFYRRMKAHYDDPAAWKFETREDYLKRVGHAVNDGKWWFHEPSAASTVLNEMMKEAGVTVRTGHRLASVEKRDHRIVALRCENGETFTGRVFIDATYEGDLLAKAGVSYRVGRESSAEYGEKYAGVVARKWSTRKQWDADIDPHEPDGSLMFGVQDVPRGEDGAGDKKVQAYNYRICLTDVPENRIPIEKPAGYDASRYDLLARYIAAKPGLKLQRGLLGRFSPMPNRKTDINDGGPFSTDLIGFSWDYPDGDEATRRSILQLHMDYTQGLLYFLGHDPRVPESVRREMLEWGYPRDEFTKNGHWTPQLYVREARRMVGAYVMTSHDLETNRTKEDSIGLGSYGADSHLVQRIVDHGVVRNEGNPNDFTPGHRPYEIPYRAITPKRDECDNLLSTFCVSASHMGFASIRMEPVFMILSESAGLAAADAVRHDVAVQEVPYARLGPKLIERKQLVKLGDLSAK
ncbi:MAG: FAD-dependent oxidoreductase [Planctomycetes bacterium]|nr:FAD-dependent oxidoreductase [Planctomycetota bacterium]